MGEYEPKASKGVSFKGSEERQAAPSFVNFFGACDSCYSPEMAKMDLLIKALDTAQWEMSEAFKGLPDADVWRRPDPRLLSVGELAAHVAFWEAQSFFGDEKLDSPLIVSAAQYYTSNAAEPFELSMGADDVLQEVQRVHAICKASFEADPHDSEEPNPFRGEWTWGGTLEYQAFHVAYHTGQMYSARHLLGHQPVDN